MTGKLIKHEWKSTYRIFLLLYLAVALISILSYGGFQWGNEFFRNISAVIISLGMVPVIAVYFVTILSGYTRSIYGDEGYLTHTLPVKAREILLCKSIMASFWGIMTLITVTICGIGLFAFQSPQALQELMEAAKYFFEIVGTGNFAIAAIMLILTCIQLLIKVYFCLAISKLPIITRFQAFVALMVFTICTYIQGKLYLGIGSQLGETLKFDTISVVGNSEAISQVLIPYGTFHIIFTIVFVAIYFTATSYILEKRLHIR